jgi:hypothetical protein
VPLSEHEQRLLEQMERALYAEDPKFASTLRGSDLRGHYRRRALLGVIGVVIGLALLPVGIAGRIVALSIVGFLIMLGSAIWAVTSWRRAPAPGETGIAAQSGSGKVASTGGRRGRKSKGPKVRYMDRLEERWRRRRDQNGR